MKKAIILMFVSLFIVVLFLNGCSTNKKQGNTLDIGEIECLTGLSSDNLKLAADGAKMAQEYINSRGGIKVNGQKYTINILLEDNKGTSDGATAAANKLVHGRGVKFIVGGAQGFINLAIASVTEPAGVLYVAEFNNGAKQELNASTPLKFFANNCSFSSQYTAMTYLKMIHPEVKTIAFIQIDDGNLKEVDPVVHATADKLGLSILGSIIGFNPTTVDTSPITQKAMALNPDAIMLGNGPTAFIAQILKGARSAGYTKPIFSCSNTPPQDILTIVGKEAGTNYFGHGISLDRNIPNLPDITKEIMDIAEKGFGKLDFEQVHGFNAVYALAQIVEAAQSFDPKAVALKWEKMDALKTSFGEGKMGGLNTYSVRHNLYFTKPIMRLEKGQLLFGDWVPAYMP